MAMQRRMKVEHGTVFPQGAFVVSEVEPVLDFNAAKREDGSRPQATDPETGLLVWSVQVVDADPEAGKREKTVTVKIGAKVQPVPPENKTGTPFTPVEFVGLMVTPWIDDNGMRPRLAWSFRAEDIVAPGEPRKGVTGTGAPKAAA